MKILLVTAATLEIKPLLERFDAMVLMPGILQKIRHDEMEIDILTPGIGIIPTAYYLGKYLPENDYDLAVNAGICGTYDPSLPLGKVVHVTEDSFPETGTETVNGFLTIYDLGLAGKRDFPFDDGILYNDNYPDLPFIASLPEVRSNTVSTLLTDPDKISALLARSPAQVETMEGAAFFFACMLENLKAIQIRAISNLVGEQNRRKWKINEAVNNLDQAIMTLLQSL